VKIFVKQIPDEFERKQRAKEILQICREFGAEPVAEGPDNFSVKFDGGVNRAGVQQFLEAVGCRGVSIEQADAPALGQDAVHASVLDGAISRGEIAEKLLPEDLWDSIDGADISQEIAAKPDEVYGAIRDLREPATDIFSQRPRELSDIERMAADVDAELKAAHDQGLHRGWHSEKGWF
jgi:hypothetical protein